MKLISSLLLVLFVSTVSWGQLALTDADYDQANPLDCAGIAVAGGGPNFNDGAANYAPNTVDTLVLCPDLAQGSKVSVSFGTNAGFTWDVHSSDTIYVFDGPNVTSPLIGAYNSDTDPGGFFAQASWNNPTGCLTLLFVSDGANEGTGWDANVACGNPQQPFTPHIEAFINGVGPNALNPLDTGYVDVCFGDSIMFVATPDFPNSFEVNGFGYSQTAANCTYDWTIGGVGQFTNDTLWFTPPARAGYFVDLRITDQFPMIERVTCKVRVSQLPLFTGTGPEEDTVCLGQNTTLVGGVTATDTVGIDIPGGEFQIGGIFAGLTQLPDGSGVQYTTDIAITGFGAGATVQSASDIDEICLDIEHSYLGDLEIALTCPNGTTVALVDTYNGGFIPGGCGGGGVYLGNDTGTDGGAPGSPVWTYCFTENTPTYGTFCNELGNTIPNDYGNDALNPNGTYTPEQSFAGFIGCPIDGNWTITVQDNLSQDDGYIFQWGIYFNQSLFPDSEGYQNYVVTEDWASDPTIVSGQNDTILVVQPSTPGNYGYTYEITDDFGCDYDTTVYLFVLPQPEIQQDTIGCFYGVQLQGTSSYIGGVWSASDTAIAFLPDSLTDNPLVQTSTAGTYTLTYTDAACGTSVSMEVEFPPYAWTDVQDTILCQGVEYELQANQNPTVSDFVWNTGDSGPNIMVTEPGMYIVTGSNVCHSFTDTAYIGYKLCDIAAPNVISLQSNMGNNLWYVEADGLATFHCTITNRWGNVIFEYDDPNGAWDGNDMNGNKVAEGVYTYVIDATIQGGEELHKHGFITVIH